MSVYNLLDEQWIPVLYENGSVGRLGILDTMLNAHKIRNIAASNPMDRVAVLRFLLAILYWCRGQPDDSVTDRFPKDWFERLNQNRQLFNLLGDGPRFYQYEDGTAKLLTANYLTQEAPTGSNFWHFRHVTDSVDGVCPACCALGLIRLPVFATSGGRGKPPAVNNKPPLYAIPIGNSLHDTLRLSWRDRSNNLGVPFWEQPISSLPDTVPLLVGLTWVPRQVWLGELEGKSICCSCGRVDRLVKSTVFAGIGSQKKDDKRPWGDPHALYGLKNEYLQAANALKRKDAAVDRWCEILLASLLPHDGQHWWIVGFATMQNDKYLETVEWQLPSNMEIDTASVLPIVELWQKQLGRISARIRKPNATGSRIPVETYSTISSIRSTAEYSISQRIVELSSGDVDAWNDAASEYLPMMRVIAKSLSPGSTVSALRRRKSIENAQPEIHIRTTVKDKEAKK